MPLDPITLITLITVIITSLSQVTQMILDYKRDKNNKHDSIYEMKSYKSSCCNINVESDGEEK